MNAALKISDLRFAYPEQRPVLQEINCTIGNNEKVGLVGPNGAGKTTLFLLVTGIIAPSTGKVHVFGQPVKHNTFSPVVGMVFQHTADQLICPSVREDIAFGLHNMGLDHEEIQTRIAHTAQLADISALLDRPPHHLSGGEKRLVALSGILAMEPRLLLMDEPTADLDTRYRRRLIDILGDMSDRNLLVASHDLEFIIETCSRVLLLEGGYIQADGRPAEVMANRELMERHGLEVPHSLSAAWHRHRL